MDREKASQAEIGASIAALHAEIEKLDTPDTAVKAKLLTLIGDLEQQLQNPQEKSEAATQQLPALIEQFEVDHPQITATLGRLLTTLSGMGI
ncbi:MAG: protein of unknown function (DUF4404) [Phormidesmis priestleyi Ana]|uniref:DUF4404 family protein n=1 Tax=Phormidesmis priestleyi Ana TaxID=1666911 RepID=A0A0P7ZVN9_9CYAN|nr:MAG: protein of unknown function (DUF4404) [Phormidesmis priestleyi Ana]